MKAIIVDSSGYCYQINTGKPELLGAWFVEHAEKLMSVNASYNHPVSLDIWPESKDEKEKIGEWSINPITVDSLLQFAAQILEVSQRISDHNRAIGKNDENMR